MHHFPTHSIFAVGRGEEMGLCPCLVAATFESWPLNLMTLEWKPEGSVGLCKGGLYWDQWGGVDLPTKN